LHERDVEAVLGVEPRRIALEEPATLVAEHLRLDEQDLCDFGGRDLHAWLLRSP
jgi:hypothetical protein